MTKIWFGNIVQYNKKESQASYDDTHLHTVLLVIYLMSSPVGGGGGGG